MCASCRQHVSGVMVEVGPVPPATFSNYLASTLWIGSACCMLVHHGVVRYERIPLDLRELFDRSFGRLRERPRGKEWIAVVVIGVLGTAALACVGFGTGWFQPHECTLPFIDQFAVLMSVLVFPCMVEEAVFRGLLIPAPFYISSASGVADLEDVLDAESFVSDVESVSDVAEAAMRTILEPILPRPPKHATDSDADVEECGSFNVLDATAKGEAGETLLSYSKVPTTRERALAVKVREVTDPFLESISGSVLAHGGGMGSIPSQVIVGLQALAPPMFQRNPPRAIIERPAVKEQILALAIFMVYHLDCFHTLPFFRDPPFLICALILGISCQEARLRTNSLWPGVVMHWLWVFSWVAWLGDESLLVHKGKH